MDGTGNGMIAGVLRPASARSAHIDSMRALALLGVIVMNIGSMVMMVNGRQVFAGSSFETGQPQ